MKSILALLLLSMGTAIAFAQGIGSRTSQINDIIQSYHDRGQFDGVALVAEDGKVIFKQGFGLADRTWKINNATDIRFQIASLTKQFTAMLTLQLVASGKLKLAGHICDYLPEYPRSSGERITIDQLLTHTSGIPSYTSQPDWPQLSRQPTTPGKFIRNFDELPLEFEPGAKFNYSNSNYYLLGAILARVTGRTFAALLKENIFGPAGMKHSGVMSNHDVLEKIATGYERLKNGLYEHAQYLDFSTALSEGAIYSTVEDMFLWDQALYEDKLLAKPLRDVFFEPRLNNYARGWLSARVSVSEMADFLNHPFSFKPTHAEGQPGYKTVIWHWGSNPGFSSIIIRLVDDRKLIVLLSNTELIGEPHGAKTADIAAEIIKALYS